MTFFLFNRMSSPAPGYTRTGAAIQCHAGARLVTSDRNVPPVTNPRVAILFAAVATGLVVCVILLPAVAFQSAIAGLRIWWDVVFPALLPFFIGSEILVGLGVVHFLGVLMEPLMRPLFNVPGTGSFVMAMGLASGYPIGTVLTSRLTKEGLCNPVEGERLMSFTNTADPLFMSGAVATGMLGLPAAGGAIMFGHYLGALGVGLLLRFHAPHAPTSRPPDTGGDRNRSLLRRAIDALLAARARDGRPFGQLLGDAVKNSVNTLLMIGGFIILFSVLIQVLRAIGLVGILAALVGRVTALFGLNPGLTPSFISGFFEISIGNQGASQAAAPLVDRIVAASVITAWSGISVVAQVAAIIQGTGMRLYPYVLSRVVHAVLAGILTWIYVTHIHLPTSTFVGGAPFTWAGALTASTRAFLLSASGLFAVAFLGAVYRSVRFVRFKA